MGRWALLLHALPDSSHHLDWLLQPGDDPAAPLISFRTSHRPDDPSIDRFTAERIRDHRPVYLEYEGPVPGGRGCVQRLAGGAGRIALVGRLITAVLHEPARTWVGRPVADARDGGPTIYDFRLASTV